MSSIKKRRVDEEKAALPASSVSEELTEIKTTMNKMMNHQMESMSSMLKMMHTMQGELNHMQDTITQLTEKCEQMQSECDHTNTSMESKYDHMKTSMETMQTTMLSRFDKVDDRFGAIANKQNYHEVLFRNRKWIYLADDPDGDYWEMIDAHQYEAAEDFLREVKSNTNKMRYGNYLGERIEIQAELTHDAQFLPHWREFANALEQYQYFLKSLSEEDEKKESTKFCLWDMELPTEVIDILSNALKSTHFRHFLLRYNNFGQEGIDFALDYLQNNHILKEFSLDENRMGRDDIQRLCHIVERHPSIEVLTLDECKGNDISGYEMLRMIMNAGREKLKGVYLSGNDISFFIPDFLERSSVLTHLGLSGNSLVDDDAMTIAASLKYNTTLRFLNLRHNIMTTTGWSALSRAVFDQTSLNSAADSNHTCYICYPDDDDELLEGLELTEMNGKAEVEDSLEAAFFTGFVRQKKVYSILSARNRNCSNVDHFENVPVELLPNMLESIQQYVNYHIPDRTPSQDVRDVKPLSIMYEILQRWDKSLATFEALSS